MDIQYRTRPLPVTFVKATTARKIAENVAKQNRRNNARRIREVCKARLRAELMLIGKAIRDCYLYPTFMYRYKAPADLKHDEAKNLIRLIRLRLERRGYAVCEDGTTNTITIEW